MPTDIRGLSIVPSTPELAGANIELPRLPGSETRLRDSLGAVRERFLFTILDCPPSLGPLTVNALVAADRVIVPVQTEYFALEGLAGLLDTLSLIQREMNPRLTVAGMVLTMHDGRTRLAQDVEREVREHFPELVFDAVIPRNVRVGEAPELRTTGHPPRPALLGVRGLSEAREGGGCTWLRRANGLGGGATRDGPRPGGDPLDQHPRRERPARDPDRADPPEPEPAAPRVRRRSPARPGGVRQGARDPPAGRGAPARRAATTS